MLSDEKDQRGERKYRFSKKNRGKEWKGDNYHSKHAWHANRIDPSKFDQMINRDTALYMTVDHHQVDTPFLYRRSTIQTIVPYNGIKNTNTQNHLIYNDTKNQESRKTRALLCNVDQIDENIWIGNKYALNPKILRENDIWIVINFSSDHQKIDNVVIFDIEMEDQRNINYETFLKTMNQGVELIRSIKKYAPDSKILCVCDQGVNRSTCLLIYYGIIEKGICPNFSLSYIEKSKYKTDRFWQSLTNLSMCYFLDKLCRAHKNITIHGPGILVW